MVDIVLHHLVNSRSERLFWALEELGLPYSVQVYQRTEAHRAPASYKGTGKAPMVELDGEQVSESGNILTRLLEVARAERAGHQGTHTPSNANANVDLGPSHDSTYHAHFAESTLMLWMQASTLVTLSSSPGGFARATGASEAEQEVVQRYAEFVKANLLRPSTENHLKQLEDYIQNNEWFSGTSSPGIGDFMLVYPLLDVISPSSSAPWRKSTYEVGEGLKAWHRRVTERPAYQRAAQRQKKEEEAAKPSSAL